MIFQYYTEEVSLFLFQFKMQRSTRVLEPALSSQGTALIVYGCKNIDNLKKQNSPSIADCSAADGLFATRRSLRPHR